MSIAKNNIRIVVQGLSEQSYEFSERIESVFEHDKEQFGDMLITPPTVTHMTASSDGRQTATIQFLTQDLPKTKEELSKTQLLGDAELEAMRFLHKPTNNVYRLNGSGGLIRVDGSTNVSLPSWLRENSTDWHQMSKSEINKYINEK